MASPGTEVDAAEMNRALNRRLGTLTPITDATSASYATETTVDTITVAVVSGRTYRVRWVAHVLGAGTNLLYCRLRETNTSGTQLTYSQISVSTANMITFQVEADWTAGATGSQVFVGTGFRQSGATNSQFRGATSQPRSLTVEYVSGP